MVFFIRRKLNKNVVNERKHNRILGLTLRQWALLDAMLIFTITAVITLCSILGYIHSKEVITILNDDIREEMLDSDGYNSHQGHGNHDMLYLSVDKVLVTTCLMTVCMWASVLNLFCAVLMMYGVTMKASKCMIPWLVVSVSCYVISFVLEIFGHFNAIPNVYISWKIVVLTSCCGPIFMTTWCCILKYYNKLSMETPIPTPTVYDTKQGYRHTISAYPRQIRKA